MPQLTKREWVCLQYALLSLEASIENAGRDGLPPTRVSWDEEEDGPPPTHEEIAALAVKVGQMPYTK